MDILWEHAVIELVASCRYIADIVAEMRNPRAAREGFQSRLVFKKRMFR